LNPESRLLNPKAAPKAVLFDLDGTLADTAPDLARALNRLRDERGLPPLPLAQLRAYASSGARGLIQAGLGIGRDDAEFPVLREGFLDHYENALCVDTRLFPGVAELLDALDARGTPWGVVTNKAERFTQPLMQRLGLGTRAACTVSGDTTPHLKPHPEPLLHASRALGLAPEYCVYLGDDLRDIEAAIAAGMLPIAVRWGYLGTGPALEAWNAGGIIAEPLETLNFLGETQPMR
jgi:phosphoglycolate phosphatase